MNQKIKKYIKEIVKFSIILIIALNIISYYKSQNLNKEKFPYEAFELLDGSTYNLPNDKPILIHFWATWCPICEIEAPNIEKISKDYEVITIATQSGTKEEIEKYLKEHNLSFKVVNDEYSDFAYRFNIKVFPTTLIYDKDKNLKFSEVGYTSTFGLYLRMWWSNY